MATGYERGMYLDISDIKKALESIAESLEKLSTPPVVVTLDPDIHWRLYADPNYGDED
jgi:hypothetical protein